MADPFPDYDSEPVYDAQYAATGKRPRPAAAAEPPVAAVASSPAPEVLMARPASKEEALARVKAMLGGKVMLPNRSGGKTAAMEALVAAAEAAGGMVVRAEDLPPVEPRSTALADTEALAERVDPMRPEPRRSREVHEIVENEKNRPPAAATCAVDRKVAGSEAERVAAWRAANPEKAREQDAAYRERNRAEFNERKKLTMRARRRSEKAAKIRAQRERDAR